MSKKSAPVKADVKTADKLDVKPADKVDVKIKSDVKPTSTASSSRKLADELSHILDELKPEDLSNLPDEDVLKMRKKLNPYGRTIEGADNYLNFSITQISHEYWKKLIITGFVGYLNRMNDEWKVPEGVPVVPVYEYLDDRSKLNTPETILKKNEKSIIYDYEFNRKWMEKRLIVKEFLEEFLQFNPDEHVRSAHKPCRADKERKPVDSAAAKLAVDHLKKTDKDFRAKEELYNDVQKFADNTTVKTKKIKKTVMGKDGKKKVVLREVPVDDNGVEIKETIVDVSKKITDVDPTLPRTTRGMIPPHDTFGRFKMYLQANYEELRDVTNDLYCEKPQFELAINPYSWHATQEEAEAYKKKHRNEVIAEIFTVCSGKWNLFDCFKEQRESVNFYNDNTIILEEMIKQHEKDERLGQDLMKKRIEKLKKKNIIESGPDAESFKKWRGQNSELTKLGASHIGDMVDDDCPPDAIEVPVWRLASGGLEITKDKFYSMAEAPEFVKEAQDKAIASGDMVLKGHNKETPASETDKAADRPVDKAPASKPTKKASSRADNLQ